jgi:energy-coupling factor transport system ATP-binding protein
MMIHVSHLTVGYGRQPALSDLSLDVAQGEFVLISGASGCGKSTLALCLAGLVPQAVPAELTGQVTVAGLDTRTHALPLLARKVGLVFQNPATQLFNITVEEEIAFAPRNLNLPSGEVDTRVQECMAATGIQHLRGRLVRALSGGEQQRVAIAAVLALRPRILVLDEPLANLDWHGIAQIAEALRRLHRERGMTIVVLEHRLAPLAPLATRVLLMDAGRIVADGAPGAILGDRPRLSALGLRFPWLDAGRRVDPGVLIERETEAEPLVSLVGVTAGYDGHTVLEGLDLSLYPGEFVALTGDNGSGKTTVARVLTQILRPSKGRVLWRQDLQHLPRGRRVGLLFQNPIHQLVCDQVEEEVRFSSDNYHLSSDLEPLLAAADLTRLRERRPQALSAGQQQRTALAATLAHRPDLLILDEPTMGQDWGHLGRLMDYLSRLHDSGQAILLITHDDRLICRYAQRIVRLAQGKVVADGLLPARIRTAHLTKLNTQISIEEATQ